MDWKIVSVSGIDICPDVGPHEKSLLEEYSGILRIGIRCGSFSVEMVEMKVFHLTGIGPSDQSFDEDVRHARHTSQMNMITGSYSPYRLIRLDIMDFFHASPFELREDKKKNP